MRAPRTWLWLALVLLGAALVLGAAGLTTTRPGGGVAPEPDQTVELTTLVPVEWRLATDEPGLHRLRVWVASPIQGEGRLGVTIGDASLADVVLAAAQAPLSAVGADGALDLEFEPLNVGLSPYGGATTLVVRLTFEGQAGERVALRAGVGEQIAFETGYESRLFDALWPISAMAAGRPGLLGWPPFYALIAYIFLVLLLRSALSVVGAAALR